MIKLGTVAAIFSGYSFNQPGLVKSEGEIAVVQMKDIDAYSEKAKTLSGFTNFTEKSRAKHTKQFLCEGDLLIMARGGRTRVIRFIPTDTDTVASGGFFVIRPHQGVVDSDYLYWYLNQPAAQGWLDSGLEKGSTTIGLPIKVLLEVPIQLPSMQLQHTIGQVARLAAKEYDISLRLAQKRLNFLNFQLEQLLPADKSAQ